MTKFSSLTLALACLLVVAGCSTPTVTSKKIDGYTGQVGKVAFIYVDSRNLGNVTSSSSRGQMSTFTEKSLVSSMNGSMGILAEKMAKFLPAVIAKTGVDATFTKVENSEITPLMQATFFLTKLPPGTLTERNVFIIQPSNAHESCYNYNCATDVTLSMSYFDRAARKIVWTSSTTVYEGPPLLLITGAVFHDDVAEVYWKLNYDKMKADRLIN